MQNKQNSPGPLLSPPISPKQFVLHSSNSKLEFAPISRTPGGKVFLKNSLILHSKNNQNLQSYFTAKRNWVSPTRRPLLSATTNHPPLKNLGSLNCSNAKTRSIYCTPTTLTQQDNKTPQPVQIVSPQFSTMAGGDILVQSRNNVFSLSEENTTLTRVKTEPRTIGLKRTDKSSVSKRSCMKATKPAVLSFTPKPQKSQKHQQQFSSAFSPTNDSLFQSSQINQAPKKINFPSDANRYFSIKVDTPNYLNPKQQDPDDSSRSGIVEDNRKSCLSKISVQKYCPVSPKVVSLCPPQQHKRALKQHKTVHWHQGQSQRQQQTIEVTTQGFSQIQKRLRIQFEEQYPEAAIVLTAPEDEETTYERVASKSERGLGCEQQQIIKLDDFNIIKMLGRGGMGTVHLVQHKATGFICAMKTMKKLEIRNRELMETVVREIKISCYLENPNIVSMYGFFDDEEHVYLLMELCCDGNLYKYMSKNRQVSESECVSILAQVVDCLGYMHRHYVIHRDIKPENIILHESVVKLCDFGWAVTLSSGKRKTYCGTPVYLSPELVQGQAYDEKIDIWATGILAYELLYGKTPFKIRSESELKKIVDQQVKFPEEPEISEKAKDFIQSTLSKIPENRDKARILAFHPFIRKNQEEQDPEPDFGDFGLDFQ